MSVLTGLEFSERHEQWTITEFYSDGSSRPGEPFQASGRQSERDQVLERLASKYPDYLALRDPANAVDKTYYSFKVELKPTE